MMKAYPEYIQSNIEAGLQVPLCWQVMRFRHLFSIDRGLGITKENLQDDGIPCVNYGEIHSKFGFELNLEKHSLKCVHEGFLETSPNSLLKKGDLVYADTSEDLEGSGNFTQLVSDSMTFAGYHTIIARQKRNHDFRFLAYALDSDYCRNQIRRIVKGVKVFSITQAILKDISVLLPSHEEQKAISSYLDVNTLRIDNLITEKQSFIKLLQEKRQALISHVVTKGLDDNVEMKPSGVEWIGDIPEHWAFNRLKQNLTSPMMYGANESAEEDNPDHPRYIRITDMNADGSLKSNTYKSLAPEIAFPYLLKDGDVLLARSGATVGKAFIYSSKFGECCFAGYLIKVSADSSKLIPEFLYYITSSTFYWEYIKGSQIQATIQNVSAEKYGNLPIPLPSVEEQKEIVKELDKKLAKLNVLVSEVQSSIDLLKEHRTALISAAVTGKIDVREEV